MSDFNKLSYQEEFLRKESSSKKTVKTDILIIGAGAAGLFCAHTLSRQDLKISILESSARLGRKLAISGGGHANFSNLHMAPEKFLAPPKPGFCLPALKEWTPKLMVDYLEKAGFTIIEKSHGRLFLQEAAINLVKYLLRECQKSSVEIYFNERLLNLKAESGYFLAKSSNRTFLAKTVILCLGSPARPKLASCLNCWQLVTEMGHRVFPAKAALTPLNYTGSNQNKLSNLAGIGLNVKLRLFEQWPQKNEKLDEKLWEDDLLFTHSGISGPAVLSASLYYNSKSCLEINFLPHNNFESMLDKEGKNTVRGLLRPFLPMRLVDTILPPELSNRKVAGISRKDRQLLGQKINAWQVGDLKAAGLDKAEVCAGGVDLEQINPKSMESLLFPGLYFCGEMQNVTGELGGYNLHWAFASARLAAINILSLI